MIFDIEVDMEETFTKEVRPLLDLIDRLREMGVQKEISLPQIVVMGDQSSGKSSVLQSISGIPFPRGSGLVTRCPLELIMKKSEPGSTWVAEASIRWNREQPSESGPVSNIDELGKKVSALTDILSKSGENGFSSDSIVVRLSDPEAPDLTLIDLPGIVRTATSGQNINVISQVNDLIQHYITLPNTIILAVVPCNQDIATIDILERASLADPQGIRTLGVLTKPDLIGPGSEDEVVEVLLNKRKPLRLGYIMVKNSSQKQLNENVSVVQARAEEDKFFSAHSVFSKYLDKNLVGTSNLTVHLTKLLVSHIQSTLPSLIRELRALLASSKQELSSIGEGEEEGNEEEILQSNLYKRINAFLNVLRNSCKGEYREQLKGRSEVGQPPSSQNKGNVLYNHPEMRLHVQLLQHYKSMQDHIMALRPLYTDKEDVHYVQLEREMELNKGRDLPGFLSSQVFKACMIMLVEEWRGLLDECGSGVYVSICDVVRHIVQHFFFPYPALQDKLLSIIQTVLDEVYDSLRDKIAHLLMKEQDPFTSQDVLLEVVNSIRFRSFDTVLRQVIDSTDVKTLGEDKYAIEEDIKGRLGKG
ncbi:hypothetical protein EON65_16210 [archaeon]|nr:MAG: hypothetical protein EON65_16210 [archaeon]